MIAFLAAALLQQLVQQLAQQPSVHGIVTDASTKEPVAAASVDARAARAASDARGRFTIAAHPGDTLRIRRVGFRARTVVIADADLATVAGIDVRLVPAGSPLEPVVITDRAAPAALDATRDVDALQATGATTTSEALSRMPFVSARSSRGEVALSMRGSRPEQVLVTLDGVPLNDPATGAADISDLPLSALGAITSLPGSAGARYGSGATGGVLALTSAQRSSASLAAESYGVTRASVGAGGTLGESRWHGGAEWSTARNDFPFENSVAVPDSVEHRVNADEHRVALFGSMTAPSVGALVLASRDERGVPGALNVRVYDQARETTERALAHVAAALPIADADASARILDFDYDDPRASASHTTSVSLDAAFSRDVLSSLWRVGAGVDRVAGTTLITSDRPRAFASTERGWRIAAWRLSAALRGDVVHDAGARLSPSVELERDGAVTLFARASQAFRAPSFYDLYFASPQHIDATRVLRPERVVFDGELGVRTAFGSGASRAIAPASGSPSTDSVVASVRTSGAIALSIFERNTHDAIVWFPGTFTWSPNNVAREVVRGIEGRASAATGSLALEVWGGARSTRLLVDGLDAPTPYVPYADGGALATIGVRAVTLSATLDAIGRRPFATVPNPSRDVELPAVALVDLAIAWRPRHTPLSLTIAVHDIADARWQSVVNYPMPGRTLSAQLTLHY